MDLTFTPNSATSQCRNVSVVDDNILEDNEVIQLLIESNDSAVNIANPIVGVPIIDDDSELMHS